MAAALFRVRLMMSQPGWQEWRVDSAGTWAAPGLSALPEAQQVIARRGLDISSHRSRLVSADLIRRFQLVLVMENSHKEAIINEFPAFSGRVYLLSEMAGQIQPVADPLGGTLIDFERTADEIDRWLTAGMDQIINLAVPKL